MSLPSAGLGTSNLPYLQGGGEMGALTRAFDWSTTPVGPPESWPQSLRTALSILLNSRFPMFLWWGPELIQFYNDAYRPSFGITGKHPDALGQRGEDCWAEIWPTISPLIRQVQAGGEATWSEDQLIPIYRNGHLEDVYWTFSYSPVRDDNGAVGGVLVVCNETTDKVVAREKLRRSEDELHFAIEAAELGIWDYNPLTGNFSGNERLKEWFGLPPDADIELSRAIEVMAEGDRQRVSDAIAWALQWESGGQYDIEYSILAPGAREERIVRAKGRAWHNDERLAYRFNGTLQDVTQEALAQRKVSESEQRFRIMAEQAPVMIWQANETAEVTYTNKPLRQFFGREDTDELVDWQGLSYVHPDDEADLLRIYQAAYESQLPFSFEARHRRHDGVYRWFFGTGAPRFASDGHFLGFIGSHIDIHERKEAERALAFVHTQSDRQQRLYEAITSNIPDLIYVFDLNYRFTYANKALLAMWGKSWDEAIGQGLRALGYEEWHAAMHEREIDRIVATKQPVRGTVSFPHAELGKRIYDYILVPVLGADGEVEAVAGTTRDITDIKLAEDAARESEARFRVLADTMPQMVWSTLPDGFHDYYNAQWYAFTGVLAGSTDGEGWNALFHPEDQERAFKRWQHSLQTSEPYEIEYRLRRNDGVYRWTLGRALPLRDDEGNIVRWFGTCTDIHDQKLLAETLEQQVAARTAELLRSNEDLQQFAHVASHDLKEPVRKIMTFAKMLETEVKALELSERARLSLDKVHSAAERMMDMVNGVLVYSKSAAADGEKEAIDLNEIIANVAIDLEVLIAQSSAEIIADKLPAIEGMPVLIQQLFYNLINNSLKFSKTGVPPRIIITGETANGIAKIVVADNGIGFEQEYAERIFKTFTRLNSKDNYEGTGLGLSLCKKIVERDGGSITAEGVEGEGAKFIITLPLR